MRPSMRGIHRAAVGALAALLAAAAFGAQAASAQAAGGVTTLNIWQGGSTDVQVTAGIKQFEKQHPNIKVSIDNIASSSYDTKVNLAVKSGHPPDIFETHGGGLLFSQFLPDHQLADLTDALPQIKRDYIPTVLGPITGGGKVYAVPYTGTQPDAIFYNKQAFSRAGIQHPPTTWSDFMSDVSKLKQHNIIPIAEGNENWAMMMWTQYIATKLGGPAFGQAILTNKQNAWSDPAFTKANQMTAQLIKAQPFEPGFLGIPWANGQPTQLVATGQAAMELQGAWEVGNMQAKTPSFATSSDLGYFSFPTVPGAQGKAQNNVAGNPATYFTLTSASPHRQAALEFFKFLLSSQYQQDVLAGGQVPGTKDGGKLLSSSHINSVTKHWDQYAYRMVQNAPYFQQSWDQALPAGISTAMTNDVGKMFAGQMTPQQMSDDLNAQARNGG